MSRAGDIWDFTFGPQNSPNGMKSADAAYREAERAHKMLVAKPYGVTAGRLWLEGHMSIMDPKIGEPYASQVEREIDAYVARVVESSNKRADASQARIEELEQKLRTTSLEALAISDTNNELQARIAELEKVMWDAEAAMWGVHERGFVMGPLIHRPSVAEVVSGLKARLSEAVKVLEEIDRLSMVIENNVKFAESHYPNIKAVMFAMSKAKAFITTLGGEK